MPRTQFQTFEGDVWVNGNDHRRVVALLGEFVTYSRGGNTSMRCKVATFRRFCRRAGTVLIGKNSEPASLELSADA